MKKIGMIVAVEMDAVLEKYAGRMEEEKVSGYEVKTIREEAFTLVIVRSGAGEIAAASATQFLLTKYGVELVVNFGVVGGLTKEMATAHVCVVDKVVHYDFDISAVDSVPVGRYMNYPEVLIPTNASLVDKAVSLFPELKRVICASGDKFIADPKQKAALHALYGAEICEMEAAGIVITCDRNQVPCLLIKCVSDSITGGAEEFRQELNKTAALCLDITQAILKDL